MQLLFHNHMSLEIEFNDTTVAHEYRRYFKHLQHVDLDFREWDNPYAQVDCKTLLKRYADKLCVSVDEHSLTDQKYLNKLHKIYEENYNGYSTWLNFHEQIHRCEDLNENTGKKVLIIDYREKAGPLIKQFNQDWLENSVTKVNAGDIFASWCELGKTPYHYWQDGEPNDLHRICSLAKPWLLLRPKISIACESVDFLKNKKCVQFNQWWNQYKDQWHAHWNINGYTVEKQSSVIKIGKIFNTEKMNQILNKGIGVQKICLN